MLNILLNKSTGIIVLLILTLIGCFRIYSMGKESGELKGKIIALSSENKNLEKQVKDLSALLRICEKQNKDCANDRLKLQEKFNDCVTDLSKEKARNVRKEIRANK